MTNPRMAPYYRDLISAKVEVQRAIERYNAFVAAHGEEYSQAIEDICSAMADHNAALAVLDAAGENVGGELVDLGLHGLPALDIPAPVKEIDPGAA